MKKLMSLACLMALIFAGASAFAADWFTAKLPSSTQTGDGWTAIPSSWVLTGETEKYGSFKDWDHPLTYQAESPVAVATEDATVITSLKFTAIDGSEVNEQGIPVDLADVPVNGAKAGLTVVQTSEDPAAYSYYGLYAGNWVQLTGKPDLTKAVEVKIALCKYDTGTMVKYSVKNEILYPVDEVSMAAPANASFQTIEFRGNCPEIVSLNGKKYSNVPGAKEEISSGVTSDEVPVTLSYNRQDLLKRGIDPDNEKEIKDYLTQKQTGAGQNGQYGWVNVALGIDDTHIVAVESNLCAKGTITLDYGFAVDSGSTVKYVIDNEESENAVIDTDESGIHTVNVQITQGGKTVSVVTGEQVGVMNTGKEVTEKQKTDNAKVFDIVAVPFAAFKGDVTVANVLNTAELNNGDTLYILNGNKYDTYVLQNGKWGAVGETSYSRGQKTDVEKIAPEAYTLKQGDAIWIERDANSKIVFTGKGETTEFHSWTWTSGEYSLVANPTVNDFVLPIGTENSFGKEGDMIIVEDVANPQQFEKAKNDLGEVVWGEWVTTTKEVRNRTVSTLTFVPASTTKPCKISAGIGFWYYNKGAMGGVTINFGKNAAE